MFEKFYGLTENPFNLTPDPKYLFLSEVHKEALAHLKYGIAERKGFVLITGEVGAGKTTICRSLLASLPAQTRTALILNPALSDIELLQTINQEFGLAAQTSSKKALLDELNEFLLAVRSEGENAVLIIDECQNLAPEVLEQIRMLSNLETETEKLLQIIMIGQPELNTILASPNLRQINDRIVLRYHLGMLTLTDTHDYIAHRLMISGAHGDIKFTRPALRRIYRYSGGLPRRINAVAERALLIGFLRGARTITRAMVAAALKELKGEPAHPYRPYVWAAVALVLLLAVAGLWRMDFLDWPGASAGIAKTPPPPEVVIHRDDWALNDFAAARNLLYQLPGGQDGTGTLNLHPAPEYLQHMDRPFIASVAGGYCVIQRASAASVWVVGRDKAIIEIPLAKFAQLYHWNIMVHYPKGDAVEIFRLADTGERVKWVQEVLKKAGYLKIEPSGVFDVETAQGIEQLQEDYGLKRDGVAGAETLALIAILGRRPS